MAHQQGKFFIDSIIYDEEKMNIRMEEVAEKIRQEREKKNLSISGLAERANLSASCISKAETARSSVSLRSLIKIAAALELSVSELLESEEMQLTNTEADENLGKTIENRECGGLERIVKNLPEDMKNFLAEMTMELMRTLDKKETTNKEEK